ncbi:NEP1-interacting protein 1-like [Rhodamnia argentea]|uniref:NEP1-interacting protein 1-like n=1 Tax=Rhodamnia argentea TaxID=178133 RepID=A0ABM3H275_9MYRT|nr:NEP1-interacting protein 1-like [Rhodamnia argentea]
MTLSFVPGFWALQWGKVRAWCCDGVSAAVLTVSYAVSVLFLAIVGSTLGALVGVLIGVKSKNNPFYSVAVGAVAGGMFLTKVFRMSVSFWLSDDCLFGNILRLSDSTTELDAGKLVQQLLDSLTLSRLEQTPAHANNMVSEIAIDQDNVTRNSSNRFRKIIITEDHLMDSSGNRNSCSICLRDFECRDVARRLRDCRHLFHLHCIDKWISKQRSCPLCGSTVVKVN